jgi:hypothetical protein
MSLAQFTRFVERCSQPRRGEMFVADGTRNTSGVPLGTQYRSILLRVIIENTTCSSYEAFYLWCLL